MPNCVNDLTPLIVAFAGFVAIQVPLLVTAIVAYFRSKANQHFNRSRQYQVLDKLTELSLLTKKTSNYQSGDNNISTQNVNDSKKIPPQN